MGIADDIRNLGREIVASFEARVERVGALKRETAEMLKGFQRENAERAREVGHMLAGFRHEMKEVASAWRNMATTIAKKRAGGR